jgi:sugar fermentation stimulation protein A
MDVADRARRPPIRAKAANRRGDTQSSRRCHANAAHLVTVLPFVSWGEPLVEAHFVGRPNRFVVEARLRKAEAGSDSGVATVAVAHLADPGRLKELLVPGRRMGLRPAAPASTRTTRWTALLVEAPDGSGWVSLNTTMPNRLVRAALASGVLSELREWRLAGWEVPYGSSRLDFLLEREEGRRMYLEAKSVTLVEDGVALFPDAVTARGARHLEELIRAREEGHEAAVLFVLQRPDALRIVAARAIDPAFADTLSRAEKAGVRVLGRRCSVTWEGIRLGARVRAEAG